MDQDRQKIMESRDMIISAIAQTMDLYGVTPSVGRIYGVLYFSNDPMTLDEIKDEVAMSKASVSYGLRELLDIEMVSKVWRKGERKDLYVAEKDFLKNFLSFFIKNLRKERTIILNAVLKVQPAFKEVIENTTDPEVQEEAKKDLELIRQSHAYFEWIQRLTYAMETGEIFEYFPVEVQHNKEVNEYGRKKDSAPSD